MKKYNLAIVGATGMVGNKFLQVLEEKKLPVENYYLFASARSAGTKINLLGKELTVIELTPENIKGKNIDFALFSAGGTISKEYAPLFVKEGAIVIDNSSCWRMEKDVPLVVPEVNGEEAFNNKGIIANPNCSTIQAVVPLKALHDKYKIKRVIFSTYQAVSGAGLQGYNDLANGTMNKFIYPIKNNLIPHIDTFLPNGYTKEEWKMIEETKKILNDYSIKVTATTVRVPVFHGHSESVNLEFEKPCTLEGIKEALENMPGIIVLDNTAENLYPMPIYAEDKDEIFVGRIRIDDTVASGCNLWVVADNIRKGAATNTIQIAEYMIKHAK
ncbi:MAG: aspartate-semialdehyde dehydrogenase [Christensenellales bacterium]|jgi:aspartate-semialdehyde dehydrogenase|nr:aspartate-semialdehyde dehydrogenase [Clostridiales bacterium]